MVVSLVVLAKTVYSFSQSLLHISLNRTDIFKRIRIFLNTVCTNNKMQYNNCRITSPAQNA